MFSLDGTIIHTSQAKVQEALDALPIPTDTGVKTPFYEKTSPFQITNDVLGGAIGSWSATFMIRFDTDASRETYWQAVASITDILQGCEGGSRLVKHLCDHEGVPVRPDGLPGCYEEVVYEVVTV